MAHLQTGEWEPSIQVQTPQASLWSARSSLLNRRFSSWAITKPKPSGFVGPPCLFDSRVMATADRLALSASICASSTVAHLLDTAVQNVKPPTVETKSFLFPFAFFANHSCPSGSIWTIQWAFLGDLPFPDIGRSRGAVCSPSLPESSGRAKGSSENCQYRLGGLSVMAVTLGDRYPRTKGMDGFCRPRHLGCWAWTT